MYNSKSLFCVKTLAADAHSPDFCSNSFRGMMPIKTICAIYDTAVNLCNFFSINLVLHDL